MPIETQAAIEWALTQITPEGVQVTPGTPQELVDTVRQYFNDHAVAYSTFGYSNLIPYLP